MRSRWERVVLVTGMPRSGTTIAAASLAVGPGVALLHEPFNPLFGMDGGPPEFHVPPPDAPDGPFFQRAVDLSYRPRIRLRGVTGTRAATTFLRARSARRATTLLVKDPTAPFLLLVEGARRCHPVVVLLRRPDAVLASYRRLGLDPRPGARYLAGRGAELAGWQVDTGPMVEPTTDAEAVGLIWRLVATATDAVGRPLVVRHEDLMARPESALTEIERHTGLVGSPARIVNGGPEPVIDRFLRLAGRRQTLRSVDSSPGSITRRDRERLERALLDRHRSWYPEGLAP